MNETRGWLREDVRMTRGFVIAVVAVTFAFFGFSSWAAVKTVNSLREDDCTAGNERRSQLRALGHQLVDNDRFLISIADNLSPNGLPDSFTVPIEARYTSIDAQIDEAYAEMPCP